MTWWANVVKWLLGPNHDLRWRLKYLVLFPTEEQSTTPKGGRYFSGSLGIQLPRLFGDGPMIAGKTYRVLFWFLCVDCIMLQSSFTWDEIAFEHVQCVIDDTGFRFKATSGSETHHVKDEHLCPINVSWLGSYRYSSVRREFILVAYYILLLSTVKQQFQKHRVWLGRWKKGPPRLQHSIHLKLLWIGHFTATVSPFCVDSRCSMRAYSGLWYHRRVSQVCKAIVK